ncbi:chromosomal replication initiator protein DnaA [Streptococcus dysgalactiae]|uniref:Chromosomal replication initiator protein DnaA n=1 Tax=Streptococcus dysgalactiae subsp. equisimilis TaxID=119602 RepID=A0AAE9QWB6_STREQ|nr:chromosomal replication initiator protein DnaA [Streptococcus dysgalactiae]MCY7208639.1 chromosomal replication initiator protein DnaA [Streptococcus dysgalactiae]OBY99520.1 chromosomal replication initiation protein DnaA [Streptococcus dysgalactiae subsp. equisimilis]OCX02356.1 chromosomal replication initiation protein DnaA [Streptococcus dysgalactiae subsp. equisimilis]OCX05837.1 chromosomal replication initiation protein DnaA [Streptococcus dysgalactiae subsp. equisimilis]VTT17614.1 chr
MTENEQIFWNRVLELAQSQLKQATYEFFVHDARLLKVENHVATIYLDQMKELFWEKNLKDVILTAGFEVYNAQIAVDYIFEEDLIIDQNQIPNSQSYNQQVITPLPAVTSDLNPKYSFENFIQGDENRWAVAASIAVANTPGTTYNPLFIWGGPGLGKTHLLNAIGNSVLLENPNARIKYITAENFINEFVIHIRLDTMDELKEKFRNLDLLLIDDIQSLAKKTLSGTQEEFFNTFNALHNNNKQIVLTSDRTPDHLNDLEDRLVTRFKWGLTVNITPPDFETRVAILTNKIQEYNFIFPQDTIEYLAGQFDSNVRDLEGALKDISLVANFKQIDTITVDVAAEAIRARKQDGPKMTVIPIEEIQTQVGKFYDVTVKEIKATKRTQDIVLARQVAMFLAREMTDNSLPKIGKEFGGRDHSTVLHAYNKIKNMISQDESLRIEIETIKNKIK